MTDTNHVMAKAAVHEALTTHAGTIVLEDLTHIRDRIRAGKRVRTRLHRWSFAQLQACITYKAQAAGMRVVHVNPAYTSQTCSSCGERGLRSKHLFVCPSCTSRFNADLNAALNLVRVFTLTTGLCQRPEC